MRGIKIPQQYFVLKRQGGLMREGGRICWTLRYLLHILQVIKTESEGKSRNEAARVGMLTLFHDQVKLLSWSDCN